MLLLIAINVALHVIFMLIVLMKPVIYYLFNVKNVNLKWIIVVQMNVSKFQNFQKKLKRNFEKENMLVIKYLKKEDLNL